MVVVRKKPITVSVDDILTSKVEGETIANNDGNLLQRGG